MKNCLDDSMAVMLVSCAHACTSFSRSVPFQSNPNADSFAISIAFIAFAVCWVEFSHISHSMRHTQFACLLKVLIKKIQIHRGWVERKFCLHYAIERGSIRYIFIFFFACILLCSALCLSFTLDLWCCVQVVFAWLFPFTHIEFDIE